MCGFSCVFLLVHLLCQKDCDILYIVILCEYFITEVFLLVEYIKAIILAAVTGLTAALPTSSSGHFFGANAFLTFSEDTDVLSLYYSAFMIAFSAVIFISLKDVYVKTFSVASSGRKNYRLRLRNTLFSILISCVIFIPIPGTGKLISDFFGSFLSLDNFLNPILTGCAFISGGLLTLLSLWYIKKGGKRKRKNVPFRSSVRMYIYSLPAYLIPGSSKMSLASVNLLLCDVSPSVIIREVYFYSAPPVLAVNLIRFILGVVRGTQFNPAVLAIGVVVSALCAYLSVSIIRKIKAEHLFIFFSVYSLLMGIAVMSDTFIRLVSGN